MIRFGSPPCDCPACSSERWQDRLANALVLLVIASAIIEAARIAWTGHL